MVSKLDYQTFTSEVRVSLVGARLIHSAWCYIEAKNFVNYYGHSRDIFLFLITNIQNIFKLSLLSNIVPFYKRLSNMVPFYKLLSNIVPFYKLLSNIVSFYKLLSNIIPFYKLLYQLIGLVGRVFPNDPGDRGSIPGRVITKTLKMVLDTYFLNTQHYNVRIKSKVEQSR